MEATPEEEEEVTLVATAGDDEVAKGAVASLDAQEGGMMAEEKEPLQLDERVLRLF